MTPVLRICTNRQMLLATISRRRGSAIGEERRFRRDELPPRYTSFRLLGFIRGGKRGVARGLVRALFQQTARPSVHDNPDCLHGRTRLRLPLRGNVVTEECDPLIRRTKRQHSARRAQCLAARRSEPIPRRWCSESDSTTQRSCRRVPSRKTGVAADGPAGACGSRRRQETMISQA